MKKILILLIVLISIFLRFYRLDDYPALNADEAAIGYNAYSLIQTGRDEHGNSWPIHFQSFNDYKPGLYFYLVIPFVKSLGLNEWAVRIPGAVLGVATVLVLYFLVKEIFEDEKLALLSSFFLAISPWHIHFSRGGWEVNSATFFITTGVLFLIRAVKNPKIYNLAFSVLALTLSLYTYHAARVIVPLLVFGLLFAYWKQVKQNLKLFLFAGVAALILLVPLAKDFTKGQMASRAAGVGLFADSGPLARIQEQRGEHQNYQGLVAKVLHNKAVNYGLAFAKNWLEHYEGEFLFVSGDIIQRNKVLETGQMYLLDIVFLVAGFVFIAKKSKGWAPILIWLLVAPVGAALTFQSPHALRAQNMVIPLVIISAYGLICLSALLHSLIKKKIVLDIIFLGFLVLFGWNFARYLHMYWFHMAKEYPFSSQYGVKELVSYVEENKDKFRKIWVTDRYDQPYILFLFYTKYPPDKFQKEHTLSPRDKYGFSTVRDFDKYHFEAIDFDKIRPDTPNTLIVGTDEEIHNEANIVKRIYGTNGYLYFEAVAN
jgi:4-amino-4-deoxy-L-arabinose transferase-like glycosyltransferase